MPKNTWAGLVIAGFSGFMGFAMIWHIWWLAIASTLGMVVAFLIYNFQGNKDYYVEVEEIEALENSRFEKIAKGLTDSNKSTPPAQTEGDLPLSMPA